MKVLAIVPARGGSKGVPRKNIRLLAGKPLINYTIEAAQGSKLVTELLVSTEDSEIAAISSKAGARVLKRPPNIAADQTPMSDVIIHALSERPSGFDVILLLQPTCPFRTVEDIDGSLALLDASNGRSVISVYQVGDHHPARMYTIQKGRLHPLFPDMTTGRRQDLPAVFHRNGAVYACRVEHFRATQSLWDDQPLPFIMPLARSLNIDEPLDFEIAELLLSRGKM